MTLPANSFASPLAAQSAPPAKRAFAELDDRVVAGPAAIVLVRAPSHDAAAAAGAHVGRRMSALGATVVHARARAGAPLWRDVAAQLGLAQLPSDPAQCASEIAHAAHARHAIVVAPLPVDGSWDRSVAVELAHLAAPPMVVLLARAGDAASDLRAETYDVAPTLDASEMRRWWTAVADD